MQFFKILQQNTSTYISKSEHSHGAASERATLRKRELASSLTDLLLMRDAAVRKLTVTY